MSNSSKSALNSACRHLARSWWWCTISGRFLVIPIAVFGYLANICQLLWGLRISEKALKGLNDCVHGWFWLARYRMSQARVTPEKLSYSFNGLTPSVTWMSYVITRIISFKVAYVLFYIWRQLLDFTPTRIICEWYSL